MGQGFQLILGYRQWLYIISYLYLLINSVAIFLLRCIVDLLRALGALYRETGANLKMLVLGEAFVVVLAASNLYLRLLFITLA